MAKGSRGSTSAPAGSVPAFFASAMRRPATAILSSPAPSAFESSVMWPTSVMFIT